jgi:hypothetical protein
MEFAVRSCTEHVQSNVNKRTHTLTGSFTNIDSTLSYRLWSQVVQLRTPFPTQRQLKPCATSPIKYTERAPVLLVPRLVWFGLV